MQKVAAYRKDCEDLIVIWDQGIVQASISLSLLGKENAKFNLHKLIDLLPPSIRTHNVLIDIDENKALQRMAMRSSNDSRVEKIKDEEKKLLFLHRFQEGIYSIKKNYTGDEIDASLTIDNKVEQLYLNVVKQYGV